MKSSRSFARRLVGHSLVLGAIVAVALAAGGTAAHAQTPPSADQGPRFGQWGPGQTPPDAEGPAGGDTAPRAPSTAPQTPPTGRSMAPDAAPNAAPYAAPMMPPAPGPGPAPDRWGGCNWDLRGSWDVQGRQTDPYYNTYSARLYVRQFRGWLQIDQPDDGISYYGQCLGDQIQLDVYQWGRFMGYQDGLVNWGGGDWQRRSRFSGAPGAPFAPPNSGMRVRSEWTSFGAGFASGWEVWQRW